jgi:hypothetical protein
MPCSLAPPFHTTYCLAISTRTKVHHSTIYIQETGNKQTNKGKRKTRTKFHISIMRTVVCRRRVSVTITCRPRAGNTKGVWKLSCRRPAGHFTRLRGRLPLIDACFVVQQHGGHCFTDYRMKNVALLHSSMMPCPPCSVHEHMHAWMRTLVRAGATEAAVGLGAAVQCRWADVEEPAALLWPSLHSLIIKLNLPPKKKKK